MLLVNAYQLQEGKSPTQKVIQLLQDMAAKGRAEKQAEQVPAREPLLALQARAGQSRHLIVFQVDARTL